MRSPLPTHDGFWQHALVQQLSQSLHRFDADQSFVVACSGGRDSLTLAAVLSLLRPAHVRVVHVNHGLHDDAARWAQHVQQACARWHMPCVVYTVRVDAGNVEAEARRARYDALCRDVQSHEVLVLGQHQQDQAETVLMRLMSGSGVQGLAAMREQDEWQGIARLRPWLSATRQQITELASVLAVDYVDDPANMDLRFDRVWLRQQLWPVLQRRWPQAESGLARAALRMQDAADIVQMVAEQDLGQCACAEGLQTSQVVALSAARQRNVLSLFMQGDAVYAPPLSRVEAVRAMLTQQRADADPRVDWSVWQIRRYQDVLYRLPQQLPVAMDQVLVCQAKLPWSLPSGEWLICPDPTVTEQACLPKQMRLLARRGGEQVHVLGRIGRWPLKKLLQSSKIAPWQRDVVQVWCDDTHALLGVFTTKGFWWTPLGQETLWGWQVIRLSAVVH
jgi:tRNA(Ile)-lysidine synthase